MSTQFPVVFHKVYEVARERIDSVKAARTCAEAAPLAPPATGALDHHGVLWDGVADDRYWGGYYWFPPPGAPGPWDGLYLVYEYRELAPTDTPRHADNETWIPSGQGEGYAAYVESWRDPTGSDDVGVPVKRLSLEEFMRWPVPDLVAWFWAA